jgi:hypothetical protein
MKIAIVGAHIIGGTADPRPRTLPSPVTPVGREGLAPHGHASLPVSAR